MFGIKSIIFEPGYFRTNIFHPDHMRIDIKPLDAYAEVIKGMQAFAGQIHGSQPGNPQKAAECIADVVRVEGMAKGKETPKRLPLGSDCLASIREKCEETLKICKEWEEVIKSTDF